MKMGILKYTKTVLFYLLLLIPYFSWSQESVDIQAESWGQLQHEKVTDAIPKKNWSSINIKNFGKIDEQYFRGAQPKNQDYADLAALGIKTVINLTDSDTAPNEKVMLQKAGMKYYQIPMDSHTPPTDSQLVEFLRLVNDRESYPVYVHCAAGKHRTGVMTAIYRMTKHKWTADQAYKEMQKYKFGLSFFHRKLKNYIYDYYRELTRASRTPPLSQAHN
jgi:protein tyrosine/serine phosphatase